MIVKPSLEMLVSECCHAEAIQYDECGTDDMGYCPECKEMCDYIKICRECDEELDENGNCHCAWLKECKAMEALYKGEVKAGFHWTEQEKRDLGIL